MENNEFLDLGKVAYGKSIEGVFTFPDGKYQARVSCGSCTVVKKLTSNRLEFIFTPSSVGEHVKSITLVDGQNAKTLTFRAEAV